MDTGIIPMRYAKALVAFAKEQKADSVVYTNMQQLSQSYFGEPQLKQVLENPLMTEVDKLKLITVAAGGKVCDEFTRFIQLVLHQRRENFLQSVSLLYIDLYRKANNIRTATLVTATSVSQNEQDRIRKIIKTDKDEVIEFKASVNSDILGGFILGIDTYRMDASLATQLKRVKAQFIEKNSKSGIVR